MRLKSTLMRSCLLLTAILFVLFLSLTSVTAQTNNPDCHQPAPLGQSEKAAIIENVRQIIGGYNPEAKTFENARTGWFQYFKCVEAPAFQNANEAESSELRAKIAQSALSSTIQSLDLNAENAEAKSIKAQIMMLYGGGAHELVREALTLDNENAEAHFLAGILNSDLASLDRAIAINPSFASAYNLKAELLLTQASKLEGKEQLAKYQTAYDTIKTMLALPSPPEVEFWREQQNSLLAMLKPNFKMEQSEKPIPSQKQIAPPSGTSQGVGTGESTGNGIGNGSGTGQGNGKGYGIGSGSGNTGSQSSVENSAVDVANPNRRLSILSKPRANYTELARMTMTSGTVRLRVTFGSDGQIKNVLAVTFLPFGLTQQAAKAAKQIKFVPETRDDSPISVIKMVEYNFNIY